ncbi:DUF2189 domain-containing protein [Hephaestia mangrovi]|uniref:DUF2189 domain-containing protein n=1 Tax=Hephaestia mangrovi TaxID=2873268 RepID=UPI001CA6F696|nr:DUF2189 domain-containing protein [Hephaestia mangrovi]MBY8829218.1 DUF2189 domain-containing protein [Hephaestia mangrovi]
MRSHALRSAPAADLPEIRTIHVADLRWALAQGWRDLTHKRSDLVLAGLFYPLICAVAVYVAFNQPLLPLLFPLVAGLSIAGPAVASGFYEIARREEEGRDAGWAHFFDPMRGRAREPLVALAFGLGLMWLAWLAVAWAIYGATMGYATPDGMGDFLARVFSTPQGWALIVLGNLAGLAFALTTLASSVIAFPMVVDQQVEAGTAIRTSLAAFRHNPRVMLGWGLRVATLLALGMIPFAIGLAVVLPWLGYATWHLYTRTVVR